MYRNLRTTCKTASQSPQESLVWTKNNNEKELIESRTEEISYYHELPDRMPALAPASSTHRLEKQIQRKLFNSKLFGEMTIFWG